MWRVQRCDKHDGCGGLRDVSEMCGGLRDVTSMMDVEGSEM
jgi:hypothetical protein